MSDKTQIDVVLILPAIPDERDACVQRLLDSLNAKAGIEKAHISEGECDAEGKICIHYDPNLLSTGRVRGLAKQAGAEIDQRYGHLLIHADSMHASKARTLESRARQLNGVLETVVSTTGMFRVEYDREIVNESTIYSEIKKLGVQRLVPPTPDTSGHNKSDCKSHAKGDGHDHGGGLGEQAELAFAGLCGVLLLAGWLLSFAVVSTWLPWGFFLGAFLVGGFFTFREAIESILARKFEIDFLMLIAAVGAAALGKWFEAALLLFLFNLGHALEHYAMGRAKKAIEALAKLAPQTALVRRNNATIEVPIEQVLIGDIAIVKPNERIPADGFVVKGESAVNQAPITGESVPVEKQPVDDPNKAAEHPADLDGRHRVFAGTINGSGAIEIKATKLANETTLARVVQLVSEAETQKSPTQQFTDRFERYFVPSTLALTFVLLFAWLVIDEPFSASFYRSMAVLVASSPCALAISTPSAVLSGIARAARGGVLIKGGGPLENLGRLNAIAFDKTGTLTEGKPTLTDVAPFNSTDENELLRVAIAVEQLSDHPLASAVVNGGTARLKNSTSSVATALQGITGRGVKATVDGQIVYIGKEALFADIGGAPIPETLQRSVNDLKTKGRTTMIVRYGDAYLGVLGLMDTPRESAKQIIAQLGKLGIQRTIMLSGDNQQVADAVAKEVGISEARGDLMPEDKV
jgi:Zn2+/Cd2+-exporting ATPase